MCGIGDLRSELVLGSDTLTLVALSALFVIFLVRGFAGNFPRVRGLKYKRPAGDSHMKGAALLVGNFELNP